MRSTPRNRRVLLILDRCGPGEAVRASPMLGAVRAAHPSASITLVVSEQAHPLFVDDPRFDRVLSSDLYGRRMRSLWRVGTLLAAVRLVLQLGLGHDLVIVFLWGSTLLNAIARITGRGPRIAYQHRLRGVLTVGPVAYGDSGDATANLALLDAAAIPHPRGQTAWPAVAAEHRTAVRRLLASRGRHRDRPMVVVHSGSDWACQQWMPDRWARVADRIAADHGADIVFTGLEDERQYIEQVRSLMTSPSISLAGETSLVQLAGVIADADLCLTVDSAAHDLAHSLGVDAVAIAGPTMPEAPPGRSLNVINNTPPEDRRAILDCQGRFPRGLCHDWTCPFAGMRNVTVERVLDAVARSAPLPAGSTT